MRVLANARSSHGHDFKSEIVVENINFRGKRVNRKHSLPCFAQHNELERFRDSAIFIE